MTREEVFAFLDAGQRERLFPLLAERRVPAGEVVLGPEQGQDQMAFLRQGRVAVRKPAEFRGKTLVIALLGPGAPLGEGCLASGRPHGAALTAVEDCVLDVLERKALDALMAQAPETAATLLRHLLAIGSIRLEAASDRLSRLL